MALLAVILVVLVLASIGIGVLAHRRGWTVSGGPSGWGDAATARFGRVGGLATVLVVGWVAVIAVGLALGFLAKNLESSVDRPVFTWVHSHVSNGTFTSINEKFTNMGNGAIVQVVCVIAIILLACAYKRRWWLPTAAIVVAFFAERYLQRLMKHVVDRGHPPTTLGTYPSGGVARILAVYGTILILTILLMPRLSRAWRAGLWTGLMTAAVVEGFTRVYLSLHWFTDALFALAFGGLLLLTNIAAVAAVAHRTAPRPQPADPRIGAAPSPAGTS